MLRNCSITSFACIAKSAHCIGTYTDLGVCMKWCDRAVANCLDRIKVQELNLSSGGLKYSKYKFAAKFY